MEVETLLAKSSRKIKDHDHDDFPRLKKYGYLKPGDEYKGVKLLEGWLFTEVEGSGKEKIYHWMTREEKVHRCRANKVW